MKPKEIRNQKRRNSRQRQPRTAPGHLATVQAFLNTRATQGRKGKEDDLATLSDLGAWLTAHALLPSGAEVKNEDLQRALDIRTGLHAVARTHRGGSLDAKAVQRLDSACRGAHIEVRFDAQGELRYEAASPEPSDALGQLLGMVAEARHRGHWDLLKTCENSECEAAYFDLKGRGRWCSHRCGERIRTREQTRRRK